MTPSLITADEKQIAEWVEQFHRDGYLFLKNVLPPELCAELRGDLDRILKEDPLKEAHLSPTMEFTARAFEHSRANLSLFELEPIVSFAEALIGAGIACHVIHNNSFKSLKGGQSTWHQDDPPHYLVTHGEPPTNVRLPVLLFTANYYLTDVTEKENGGTEVIPGSHLFGKPCPPEIEGTEYESKIHYNLGPAGSVIMFNNQVWHRGGPNRSERTRYITQVSYARRLVGHKFHPFMNYQMPAHVYEGASERKKRLLGFLPRGAYG